MYTRTPSHKYKLPIAKRGTPRIIFIHHTFLANFCRTSCDVKRIGNTRFIPGGVKGRAGTARAGTAGQHFWIAFHDDGSSEERLFIFVVMGL